MLVHLFHEQVDDARAKTVAETVLGVLSTERVPSAAPTDLTTDSADDEATPLSPRELQVLRLLALALETKEIADQLNLSSYTILNHIRNARI